MCAKAHVCEAHTRTLNASVNSPLLYESSYSFTHITPWTSYLFTPSLTPSYNPLSSYAEASYCSYPYTHLLPYTPLPPPTPLHSFKLRSMCVKRTVCKCTHSYYSLTLIVCRPSRSSRLCCPYVPSVSFVCLVYASVLLVLPVSARLAYITP